MKFHNKQRAPRHEQKLPKNYKEQQDKNFKLLLDELKAAKTLTKVIQAARENIQGYYTTEREMYQSENQFR